MHLSTPYGLSLKVKKLQMQNVKKVDLDSNIIFLPGTKKRLVERTHSENAFHTISNIRTGKDFGTKKIHFSWLAVLLCLCAGLFVGAEIYLYLSKGMLG